MGTDLEQHWQEWKWMQELDQWLTIDTDDRSKANSIKNGT